MTQIFNGTTVRIYDSITDINDVALVPVSVKISIIGPDGNNTVDSLDMEVTAVAGSYAYYYDCVGVGDHVYSIVATDSDGNVSITRGIIEVV